MLSSKEQGLPQSILVTFDSTGLLCEAVKWILKLVSQVHVRQTAIHGTRSYPTAVAIRTTDIIIPCQSTTSLLLMWYG